MLPLDGGVRTGFNLSLNGKWPSFSLHHLSYTTTSKKDSYNLTKRQKVENKHRKNLCLIPQSTVHSQHGLDYTVGCTPPEGHLEGPRVYRCISGLGTGAMESPGEGHRTDHVSLSPPSTKSRRLVCWSC